MPILLDNAIDKGVKTFDLTSSSAIAKDNGTITGSPTFSRDGCDMDGTNDYIEYAIPNTLLSHDKLSIVVEFTPDFAADSGTAHYLYDTTTGQRLYCSKQSANTLIIHIGGGTKTIALLDYQAYWKQNERNVLQVVVSIVARDIWVYLNGTNIVTDTNWGSNIKTPTELHVGSANDYSVKFDGEIHSITIKNDLTTAQEAQDLYDNSTFNFQNKASVWLDMKSQVGKASGTELIIGSDMVYTNWTAGSDATLTNPSTGILRVAYGGTASPIGYQNILGSGKRYRVKGSARGDGTAKPAVGNWLDKWEGTTSADWQEFDFVFTYDTNALFYLKAVTTSASYAEFKDVSVELIEQYTPDKSGHGNDFLLGDGDDTTLMPAFSNPGFNLDGSDDHFRNYNTPDVYGSVETSIVMCFKPDFATDEDVIRTLTDSKISDYSRRYTIQKVDNGNSNTLGIRLGGILIANIAEATYKPYWKVHGLNVVVVAGITGATNVYLNGFKILDADSTGWSGQIPDDIVIGGNSAGSQTFDGEIYHFSVYKQKLTPIQIRQITQFLLNQYS